VCGVHARPVAQNAQRSHTKQHHAATAHPRISSVQQLSPHAWRVLNSCTHILWHSTPSAATPNSTATPRHTNTSRRHSRWHHMRAGCSAGVRRALTVCGTARQAQPHQTAPRRHTPTHRVGPPDNATRVQGPA